MYFFPGIVTQLKKRVEKLSFHAPNYFVAVAWNKICKNWCSIKLIFFKHFISNKPESEHVLSSAELSH